VGVDVALLLLGSVLCRCFESSLLLGPDHRAILDARGHVAYTVRAVAPQSREGLLS
jgi:hypothetical protein